MAEAAAPAKQEAAPTQISLGITGSPVPLNPGVSLSGSVVFVNLPPTPVFIWTWASNGALANIFNGEQNDCLPCQIGSNGPFTFNPNVVQPNQTVYFQANAAPPSARPAEAAEKNALTGVRGTIKIGSMTHTA